MRGYKEEGTTTTPFDMTVMNDLDRYHLVIDVIDRVPGLGRTAAYLRQDMQDRLIRQCAVHPRATARTRPRSGTGPGPTDRATRAADVRILVVNAGSQSVKLRVIGDDDQVLAGQRPRTTRRPAWPTSSATSCAAGRRPSTWSATGSCTAAPASPHAALIDDAPDAEPWSALSELAPLHNPPALAAIDALARLRPHTPSVACFDTAFHAHLPDDAAAYAVPADWVTRWGIRRFGFHGLSCAWATRRAAELLGRPVDQLRIVICHLGGGASVTAVSPAVARSTPPWASRRSKGW